MKLVVTSDASTVDGKNTLEYPFTISLLDGCLLDALTGTSTIDSFVYYIDDTGLRPVPAPTYSQSVANCNVEWSLVALDVTDQEVALSSKQALYAVLQPDGSINVNAGDDYDIEGEVWKLRLKVRSTVSTQSPNDVVVFDFSISMLDGCLNDILSAPSTIADFNYYIGHTGLETVPTPTFTQDLQNCPITWELVAIDGFGAEGPLTADQTQFVTLKADGSIEIDTGTDYTAVDQVWSLRLKATSSESSTSSMVEYDFAVSVLDGCTLDTLTDPSTIDSFTYYLDDTGLYPISTPTYTQLVTICNVEWSIFAINSGTESQLSVT